MHIQNLVSQMKTLYIVMLLLEWQPKVVTIAHRALYQHTTSVVSLTDVFLFGESALVTTQ